MLIELVVFVIRVSSWYSSCRECIVLTRVDEINSNAEAWLCRVNFHLCVLLVLLALRLYLINGLFQKNLKLSLGCQLFVILLSSGLEKSAFILHHFPKFLHDSVISAQFFLFSLDLALRDIDQRTALLIGCCTAQSTSCATRHMGRSACSRCREVSSAMAIGL